MPEWIDAGVAHVLIHLKIIFGVELQAWIAPLAPAGDEEVQKRIDFGRSYVGVCREIVGFIEMRADNGEGVVMSGGIG